MSTVDWKVVAPKRADWERLSAECEKRGLPRPSWVNGTPTGLTEEQTLRLAEIATSFQADRKRVPKDSSTEGLSSFPPESKEPEPAKKPAKRKKSK